VNAPRIKQPVAPPVYRPQPVPRVLQAKKQTNRGPHPATTSLALPVNRTEQKRVGPALMRRNPTNNVAQRKAPAIQRHVGSRSVVQRAEYLDEEGLLPQVTEELNDMARQFNRAYTGNPESRHTQAVAMDEDDGMMMYTQRWMAKMGEVSFADPIEFKDNEIVIGDQKNDENIHAEMLAISWYLQGKAGKPAHMGVNKPVCARCSVVLNYFNVAHYSDGDITKNWTSPWRHANQHPPNALKGRIPEIVRKGVVHNYDDADWE
jgi:OTT_1508-like deaminase